MIVNRSIIVMFIIIIIMLFILYDMVRNSARYEPTFELLLYLFITYAVNI